MSQPDSVKLSDKFTKRKGRVFISGNQALVRLPLLQREMDQKVGLNTAGFISGYRGSPLGGYDSALWKAKDLLAEHQITFQPGVNEDLAATAVWGSQQLKSVPDPSVDGVFSIWYGKGPGVDRAGDPIKHGNYAGTHANGGVLVVYGDDHPGKSSTICHQSEQALAANSIPSLYPANVGEFFEFGLLGWALSRYSGLWVGFKGVNETVDQTATVDIDLDNFHIEYPSRSDMPEGAVNLGDSTDLVMPHTTESNLVRYRLPLVHRFVRANRIDREAVPSSTNPELRKLGIVTAGKTYLDVMQALQRLGIDNARAAELGLSVYKVGCIWPLEPEGLKEFADSQDELLFIEEKRAFMEDQAAKILFNEPLRPRIIGKKDEKGEQLMNSDVQLEPAQLAQVIAARLINLGVDISSITEKCEALRANVGCMPHNSAVPRTYYFCSGCPHNTSTRIPEGSLAMAGIGCHGMAYVFRPDTMAPAQMGGEGVQWVGLSPFTKTQHVFQNLGDGTYYHSGLMAIRAAVAGKVNITYKILYNDAVAMTGGQPIDGPISVGEITQQVIHEGVTRCVIVTDSPDAYRNDKSLAPNVEIYHRDRLDHVQRELREIKGCTVMIYEQTCAAEKRRRRKRGQFPDPAKRMFINEDVCEGCGDCSVQSTCVSIQPKETPQGQKRMIDQSSCNKDFSCNKGFCPSFVTVLGGSPKKPKGIELDGSMLDQLPVPASASISDGFGVIITGIGGTGVITVGSVLGMAAHMEGKACSIYDMTGMSQKNGAVYSHLKIAASPDQLNTQRLGVAEADLMLGFDLVAASADEAFRTLSSTSKVVGNSDVTPTAMFQLNPKVLPDAVAIQRELVDRAGEANTHFVDATGLALQLLGDTIAANFFVVGYAAQKGLLPLSIEAITAAIELNGMAVAFNLNALGLGRLYAHDPAAIQRLITPAQVIKLETLADLRRAGVERLSVYQDARYAERYSDFVDRIAKTEASNVPGSERLARTVATNLAKLMAYKDEYEVARMHSDPKLLERLKNEFDGDFKLKFNMAPPLLSKRHPDTGLPVKREFGAWMLPAFRILAKLKGLRGTRLDIFGYTDERRMERQLIEDYCDLISRVVEKLTKDNLNTAVALAELPQDIRGFGHVKERKFAEVKQREQQLVEQFEAPAATVQQFEPKAVV